MARVSCEQMIFEKRNQCVGLAMFNYECTGGNFLISHAVSLMAKKRRGER